MKICFKGDIEVLKPGIEAMQERLGYEISVQQDADITVTVSKSDAHALEYYVKGNDIGISYAQKVFFFRALSFALNSYKDGKDINVTEDSNFTMDGLMVDCSRNGVLTKKGAKDMLSYMAMMGLDMMMLYTEDTYEIPEYEYFGHNRGRYSKAEIKEIDQYAFDLGIELIPCIQTAAHLNNALKWTKLRPMNDMPDSLLEGEPMTYEFIDNAVKACADMFRTKKIHIGYDEAVSVGRGQHLDRFGYEKNTVILQRHLDKVKEILKKYDREPMMWGDMYYNMNKENGTVEKDGMGIVYWDYYQAEEKNYLEKIDEYKEISDDIIFAGGSWTWNTVIAPYFMTYYSTIPALRSCLAKGLKRVFVTMWGDDGQETSHFAALPGLQMYAEFRFCKDKDDIDEAYIAKQFKACIGADLEAFKEMARIDMLKEDRDFYTRPANGSKAVLFQNPMFGPYDKDLENTNKFFDLTSHYAEYEAKMEKLAQEDNDFAWLFNFPAKLCKVAKNKWNLGLRIKDAYDRDDKTALKELAKEMEQVKEDIIAAREAHRKQWFRSYKPQGWDSMDLKYGSLLCQVDTGIMRLNQYANGTTCELEELYEERISFSGEVDEKGRMGVTHYFLFGTGALL